MLLWFCLVYDTARCCIVIVSFFSETMDRLIRRSSSCCAYDLNRYDVMRTQPQECTRRTHTVSCGWTNVHDLMHSESYIRTQRTSTSKLLHAPCSYKHWAATASLLLGIFFGFILIHQLNSMKIGWLQSVIAAGSIWLQKQWKTMNKHRAPFSPFKSFQSQERRRSPLRNGLL